MLDQLNSCGKENIIHQLVKVQAQVKIKPLVKHGIPRVYCVDSCIRPHFDRCNGESIDFDCCNCDHNCDFTCGSDNSCNFTLTQLICVEIPISFNADVDIKKGIVCCGDPDVRPESKHDSNEVLNRNPIYILMNNKILF